MMMSDAYRLAQPLAAMDIWPPDDTEESVVGTDLHQMTIINLRWGLNEIAGALTSPGQPAPWQALSQTVILGFQRPDGSRYETLPDVFVYRQAIGRRRGSVSITIDGAPVLIIEVLSESTYEVDLDLERGKGFSYARAGVREYLALDPTGEFLLDRGRAWRLEEGVYRPWHPDAAGRWRSEEIAVAVGMESGLAAVYTLDGRRQLREGEVARELARANDELNELRRFVAQLKQPRHESPGDCL
jgi:Putative restriction endonuclease